MKSFYPRLIKMLFIAAISTTLTACVSQQARLVQGKQSFIEQDYHQAFKTLQPLAVQGIPDAQYAVGYMYYYGYGVPQNNQLALKWMQSAATQGQPNANKALDMIQASINNSGAPQNPVFTAVPPDYQQDIQNAMANQPSPEND